MSTSNRPQHRHQPQDTFVPLADDQRHWYATETPETPADRERDENDGWLSRPSER